MRTLGVLTAILVSFSLTLIALFSTLNSFTVLNWSERIFFSIITLALLFWTINSIRQLTERLNSEKTRDMDEKETKKDSGWGWIKLIGVILLCGVIRFAFAVWTSPPLPATDDVKAGYLTCDKYTKDKRAGCRFRLAILKGNGDLRANP